ncbi:NYN domain-containing protein [Sphingomonas sp.]|uniref:NYN domain-containing protein n=1 Tax=Sphingomonas sp. TaxID=28214 RepID=UPI002E32558A|nr:NYN domain-containing protein [Sphingomonas sp.]HEX4693528.1 NYN domain-containing protein [Sphingomonas sp.]
MIDDTPTRNIALLIDADNASWHKLDPVLTVLAELGTVNIRRAYGNWSKSALNGWRDMTIKYGIEPQQQFDLTKGKNATDMKMTIDAMDLLSRGRVEGFGIMSSDSDFMPLAMRIRQDGLPVYGFGGTKAPEAFRAACTRFIDVDALGDVSSDEPLESPVVAAEKSGTGAVDEAVRKLLLDAYQASKRDERGFVSLSAMGQLAANRSSFDVRNYGYKRLSDLIEAVSNFQIERREGGRVFVKRMR